MRTIITGRNQTIFDIAMQHYGDVALFDKVIELNPGLVNDYSVALELGVNFDFNVFDLAYPLMPGQKLKIDPALINPMVTRELAGHEIISERSFFPTRLSESRFLSFSRESIAYTPDGVLVNTNLPRFVPGRFGKAVMVEEATTNLIHPPRRNIFGGATRPAIIDWTLAANFRLSGTDGDFGSLAGTVHPTILASTDISTVTISFRNPVNTDHWMIHLIDANWQAITAWATPPTGWSYNTFYVGWFNGSMSGITSLTITNLPPGVRGIGFGFRSGNVTGGILCSIERLQIEAKPYSTTFIDGTRVAETLTIPTAGVLDPTEGTIELWYNPREITNHQILWSANTGAPGGFSCVLSGGRVLFSVGDGVTSRIITSSVLTANTWVHLAFVWRTSGTELYLNGVKAGQLLFTPAPNFFPNFTLSHGDTAFACNAYFDDLRISNIARTDAEILAAFNSNAPLPVDAHTTFLARFDGNLAANIPLGIK